MEAVWVGTSSALARGRRLRGGAARLRHRTTPVTFAEIKEVDEESAETEVEACEERCGGASVRRRPDVLEERLGKQFMEFRRRRANKRDVLRERDPESPPAALASSPAAAPSAAPAALARAGSEPTALHHSDSATDT